MQCLNEMQPNGQKIQISQACSEQWHSSVLRRKPVEVPEEAQWLWCQIYWTCAHVSMVVMVWEHPLCMHAWFRHPQNLPVMAYTHRRKKPSASSKSECLEEEGLKHLFLITSSNCFINVVYLVSVSLEIYSRNVSVSTYLTSLVIWCFKDLQGKSVCLKVRLLTKAWQVP